MRIVALEEHVNVPDLVAKIPESAAEARGWPRKGGVPASMSVAPGDREAIAHGNADRVLEPRVAS